MLIVKYAADGNCYPDHAMHDIVKEKIKEYLENHRVNNEDMVVCVSNELAFNYFVLFAMKNMIDYDDIELYYNNKKCIINQYVGIKFADDSNADEGLYTQCLDEILKIGFANIKRDGERRRI